MINGNVLARKKELSDLIADKESDKRALEKSISEAENQLIWEKESIRKNKSLY